MEPPGGARHRWENRKVECAGARESKREPSEFQSTRMDTNREMKLFACGEHRPLACWRRLPAVAHFTAMAFSNRESSRERNPVSRIHNADFSVITCLTNGNGIGSIRYDE